MLRNTPIAPEKAAARSADRFAIDRRALVLEAAEDLPEVVRSGEAPFARDLFQRRARRDQRAGGLADPDLRHEARRRQGGAGAEEMREVAAAPAALGGQRVAAERLAWVREHAATHLVQQALALAARIVQLLRGALER